MNYKAYLHQFQNAAGQLDKSFLAGKQLEIAVGVVLDSAYLKIYKKHWANPSPDPLTAESRIFFSIWVNDSALKAGRIYYNIHALKLRKLRGYTIESRKFAEHFRAGFKKFAPGWPHVRVNYGPLTLMEGWTEFIPDDFQNTVSVLIENFFEIEHLVDKSLERFKK